jgi:hypothetical protein
VKSEEFLAVQASQSAERLPLCMKNKTTIYREAGVKVRIEHPSSTQPAITRLRNNMCQATTLPFMRHQER